MSDLSLIPYLEPGNGKFFLNVVSPCPPPECEGSTRYPFQLLDDAPPFSRLLKAELVSGEGGAVSPLFLLVQRDRYRFMSDTLWPIDNSELDRYWQQTFSCISGKQTLHCRRFPLKNATTPEGKLIPFRSLFFCSVRKRFFHPPCPTCGRPLELCEDDGLLSSKNLPAFATSLRRFLYCPACVQDESEVYADIREDTDPPVVKDRRELIRLWRNIVTGRMDSKEFPCAHCTEQTTCYGNTALFEDRIVPFFFYPSYMLAFDAMSISAVDFLPMLSGASVDDILPVLMENNMQGRHDCLLAWRHRHGDGELLLFRDKAELFLEILYLKLSFLGDVARMLLSPAGAPVPPDMFATLDSLWVKFPDQNGLLPGFWNFKTGLFAIGPCGTEATELPKSPPASARYYLGIIWFFALLGNKRQPIQAVKKALAPFYGSTSDAPVSSESPEFAPENNFWDPDAHPQRNIPEEWQALWTRSLHLGLDLLRKGGPEGEDDSAESFHRDLEAVRSDIKDALFFRPTIAASSNTDTTADEEIYHILSRISDRWKKTPPAPRTPEPEEEAFTQTVIISGKTADVPTDGGRVTETRPAKDIEEDVFETVILKPKAAPPAAFQPAPKAVPTGTPDRTGKGTTDPVEESEEEVLETVIIKPKAATMAPPPAASTVVPPGPPDGSSEETDLMKTLILPPDRNKDRIK